MAQREFSFKAEPLTAEEIELIADCVVRKLLNSVPALGASSESKPVETPIKMNDVCRMLRVSDTTVRSWMRKGELPFYRKGNRVYFLKSEVLKFEQPLTR